MTLAYYSTVQVLPIEISLKHLESSESTAMRAQMSKIFGHGLVLRGRGVVVYAGICKDDYGIDQQECT